MGFAVPGALAARLAYPDRPVVAFTGDGGFMMAIAELQTAVRKICRLSSLFSTTRNCAHPRETRDQGTVSRVSGLAVSIGNRWRRVSVPTV